MYFTLILLVYFELGDSAGGNLVAAVTQKLKQRSPSIKTQVLIYPALQALDFRSPSYQQESDFVLNKEMMVKYWLYYAQGHVKNTDYLMQNRHVPPEVLQQFSSSALNHSVLPKEFFPNNYRKYNHKEDNHYNPNVWNAIKGVLLNPDFAPLVASDFRGLPKTFVFTGFFDVLRDDGAWYAEALIKAHINVTHLHARAAYHGMFFRHNIKEFRQIYEKVVNYIQENL